MAVNSAGALVLVATPIGNMGDLAPRAVEELGRADVIACEDTRRTGRLLARAGVASRPLLLLNEHNEEETAPLLAERIRAGERVAYLTDAGTPGVADPGEHLVGVVAAAGCNVTIVPGPSAPLAAVALSGLTAGRFVYEGFLPRRGVARTERVSELAASRRAVVILESARRCGRTAVELAGAFGPGRRVMAARELTKLHEEVWRGTLEGLAAWAAGGLRGELVLVIEGASAPKCPDDARMVEALIRRRKMSPGVSVRDLVSAVAADLGAPKRRVYELAHQLEHPADDPPASPAADPPASPAAIIRNNLPETHS